MSNYSRCSVNSQKLLAAQDVTIEKLRIDAETSKVEAEKSKKEALLNKMETVFFFVFFYTLFCSSSMNENDPHSLKFGARVTIKISMCEHLYLLLQLFQSSFYYAHHKNHVISVV